MKRFLKFSKWEQKKILRQINHQKDPSLVILVDHLMKLSNFKKSLQDPLMDVVPNTFEFLRFRK
jgi:hypothetical protein